MVDAQLGLIFMYHQLGSVSFQRINNLGFTKVMEGATKIHLCGRLYHACNLWKHAGNYEILLAG